MPRTRQHDDSKILNSRVLKERVPLGIQEAQWGNDEFHLRRLSLPASGEEEMESMVLKDFGSAVF